jgi:hypothetical protein
MEFDQVGVRVFRDKDGNVKPFDRTRYDFISMFWDYASFKSETCGIGIGVVGNHYEMVFYFRMAPANYGGAIDEDVICRAIDISARVVRPDWLGYDGTGVGEYLSKTIYDPAYGYKEYRRPRTDLYPYAEAAEPIYIDSEFKSSGVTKLKIAMRQKFLKGLPLDQELQRQFRLYKRTVSGTRDTIRYAAQGKNKKRDALDDIVTALIGAFRPLTVEEHPVIIESLERDVVPVKLYDSIRGIEDTFTSKSRNIYN